mmetsp:Transcript_41381/g.88173  ORF Transcript_41381/g.88173 Transcript_41381/m.88173 type:complete len:308 (-) Transcript_41381:37-960(-)
MGTMQDARAFCRGVDFERAAYKCFGLSARDAGEDNDPVWELRRNLLSSPPALPLQKVDVEGITGAFLVQDLLSAEECASLVRLGEDLGFTSGGDVVDVPTEIRSNDVCVFVAPGPFIAELSGRLAPLVPQTGAKGMGRCRPDFVNARLRLYRYTYRSDGGSGCKASLPPQRFGPHYDGAQAPSAIAEGRLVDDSGGGACRSQLSVLLYLNDGHAGGETVFYPSGDPDDMVTAVRIAPQKGAALCFWHGDHPLSPLHEGAALAADGAPKYVIRTDILFYAEAPPAFDNAWESSNYVHAMLRAVAVMGQ